MTVQQNPFVYGRPVTREENLADREDEKRSMRGDVVSGQAVMLLAPRRHGIRSPGSVGGAVRTLVDLGELETGNDGSRPPTRSSPRGCGSGWETMVGDSSSSASAACWLSETL